MISPVRTSVIRPAAAMALYLSRAVISSSRSACCTRRSTASSTGLSIRSTAKPRHVQIGKPARVQPFLDAGNALVVDIHMTDEMRDLGAVRIDALVLGEKADAGNAEPVDFLLLLRRDLALEPDEAFA